MTNKSRNDQEPKLTVVPTLAHGGADIPELAKAIGLDIPLQSPFTVNDLNKAFPLFRAVIREDAKEKSRGSETGKGYDTTGYGYQSLVDRLNEVVGIGHWQAVITNEHYDIGKYSTGRAKHIYELTVRLELGYPEFYKDEQGLTKRHWVTITEKDMVGTHESPTRGDAWKGAYTNGLKKCVGFYGPGADAYLGIIDEDNRPLPPGYEGEQVGTMYEDKNNNRNNKGKNRTENQDNRTNGQAGENQGQGTPPVPEPPMTQKTFDTMKGLVANLSLPKEVAAAICEFVTQKTDVRQLTEKEAQAYVHKLQDMEVGLIRWTGEVFEDMTAGPSEDGGTIDISDDDLDGITDTAPPTQEPEPFDLDARMDGILAMKWPDIQNLAKESGLPYNGVKKDDLVRMIAEAEKQEWEQGQE
jgi:hypothetical protein